MANVQKLQGKTFQNQAQSKKLVFYPEIAMKITAEPT